MEAGGLGSAAAQPFGPCSHSSAANRKSVLEETKLFSNLSLYWYWILRGPSKKDIQREVTGCARKRGSKKVRKLVTRPGFSNHCSPPMEKKEGKKKGGEKKKKNLFSARFPVDVAKF